MYVCSITQHVSSANNVGGAYVAYGSLSTQQKI